MLNLFKSTFYLSVLALVSMLGLPKHSKAIAQSSSCPDDISRHAQQAAVSLFFKDPALGGAIAFPGSGTLLLDRNLGKFYILTAYHVVGLGERISTFEFRNGNNSSGKSFRAQILVNGTQKYLDSDRDLAILEVTSDIQDFDESISLVDLQMQSPGDAVYTAGWPNDLEGESQSLNLVCNGGRVINPIYTEIRSLGPVINHSALAVDGMSGGPLFDRSNQIIGINQGNVGINKRNGELSDDSYEILGIPLSTFKIFAPQGLDDIFLPFKPVETPASPEPPEEISETPASPEPPEEIPETPASPEPPERVALVIPKPPISPELVTTWFNSQVVKDQSFNIDTPVTDSRFSSGLLVSYDRVAYSNAIKSWESALLTCMKRGPMYVENIADGYYPILIRGNEGIMILNAIEKLICPL